MIIKTDYLKFLTIYEEKSLSNAAIKLDVYQAALSKTLKKIEDELSHNLFIRTNRGILPTEQGHKLYSFLKNQINHWNTFNGDIQFKDTVTGVVRIGGHPIILNQFDNVFANIISEYPSSDLEFSFARSADITRRVLNFELEFGLVVNPMTFNDLVLKPLSSDEIALFSSKKNFNSKIIIYNPELISKAQLVKNAGKKVKLMPIANLSLSISIAKKLNCQLLIPHSIATGYGFKNKTSHSFNSSTIYLIYRNEQKFIFNTRLITDLF